MSKQRTLKPPKLKLVYVDAMTWKQFKKAMKDHGVAETAIVYGKLRTIRAAVTDGPKITMSVLKPKKVKKSKLKAQTMNQLNKG